MAVLLEAVEAAAPAGRFVHIGSAAEYGPGERDLPVAETACPVPVNAYGASKLAATELVVAARSGGLDATVLRVFNPLGPGMAPATLPGAALQRLREAVAGSVDSIRMGPLDSVRDFVDVRDVASAVVAACRAPRLEAPVVNVGSGVGHTPRELVIALAARLGFEGRIVEDREGSPRSADVPWQVADVRLAAEALGWRAAYDLAASVDLLAEDGA